MKPILTEPELDLLNSLSMGDSYRQIAERRNVTVNTVKTHASRMYLKLGARNAAHAVRIGGLDFQLIGPSSEERFTAKVRRDGHTLACVAAQSCPGDHTPLGAPTEPASSRLE